MESNIQYMYAVCIVLILASGHVLTANVPDDTVWTAPTAVFWLGQGMFNLTCDFRGDPIAVYWMKGETFSSAITLIRWYGGRKSGPGLKDGSLDISDGYSLVFSHPDASDTGKYFCRVSNHNGILIYNHTDLRVLDPGDNIVSTVPNIPSWAGDTVTLPCDFQVRTSRAIWNKEQGVGSTKSLQTVARYQDGSSFGSDDGHFGMRSNFALVIYDIRVLDEANFTCQVLKMDGTELKNSTSLTVNALAEQPFVHMDNCANQSNCTLLVHQALVHLNCSVFGAKPNVTISWTQEGVDEDWNHSITSSFNKRKDGTYDQTSTMTTEIGISENFTCTAQGIAVNGTAEKTVTVHFIPIKNKGKSAVVHYAALSFVLLLIVIVITVIVLIFRRRHDHRYERSFGFMCQCCLRCKQTFILYMKRRAVSRYKPAEVLRDKVSSINIGVFGVMAAGKSAFINSIAFAHTGKCVNITEPTGVNHGGSDTKKIQRVELTRHIHLFDSRGLIDYSKHHIPELMALIRGEKDEVTDGSVEHCGKKIHCPILVCNLKDPQAMGSLETFLIKFAEELEKYYGRRRLMVVLTYKKDLKNVDEIKDRLHQLTNIQKKNIRAVNNYTLEEDFQEDAEGRFVFRHENNDEDEEVGLQVQESAKERSLQFLQLILDCIQIAELNINAIENNENNVHETVERLITSTT